MSGLFTGIDLSKGQVRTRSNAPKVKRPFQVQVSAVKNTDSQAGNPRLKVTMSVMDDGFKGQEITDGFNLPCKAFSEDTNRIFLDQLVTFLTLAGLSKKVIDRGPTEQEVVGSIVYVDFTPARYAGNQWAKIEYMTAKQYNTELESWNPENAQVKAASDTSEDIDL